MPRKIDAEITPSRAARRRWMYGNIKWRGEKRRARDRLTARRVENDIDFYLSSVSDLNSKDGRDNANLTASLCLPHLSPSFSRAPVHQRVDRIQALRGIHISTDLLSRLMPLEPS